PESATRLVIADNSSVLTELWALKLNADLSSHADVPRATSQPLASNAGLVSRGFQLVGAGFQLQSEAAEDLLLSDPSLKAVIREYRNGKDLATRPRRIHIIDFGLRDEDEARAYPVAFDIVRTRVKPERDANGRASYAKLWWRFGEPRKSLRTSVDGLSRYIATPQTAKHRYFVFLDASIAPDDMVVAISVDDAFFLGVLSSQIHVQWSVAAGSRLGVGNDSRYTQSTCFSPFPFPHPNKSLRASIAALAESLDLHRSAAIGRDKRVTMTGMYNVVEKLRAGEALAPKERTVHELAACGILRDMHEQLDALVAEAYGWQWPLTIEGILERLVALHDDRVAEEVQGLVRWLRPEFQAPGSNAASPAAELSLETATTAIAAVVEPTPWPTPSLPI
ncbi:type IIL restriction-modification enzyme MmeI, partial [Gemmatimonas sp.]|uniref:type IIL restriction-modification enzyme MmeI n=1 Tax=Gemmatimonas sp. TaxID=1962908 RepID=UPI00286C48DC